MLLTQCPMENRMIETIEIKWDLLGAKLATLSDEEQRKFFKGFAYELGKFESKYKAQMQMCYVADKLDQKEKDILEDAFSVLWIKE